MSPPSAIWWLRRLISRWGYGNGILCSRGNDDTKWKKAWDPDSSSALLFPRLHPLLLPPPLILSLSAVPPRLLSGIIYRPTTPPPSPQPTVPSLGTGLSSEVTLTLARALPLNPISPDRYCQPACCNRYGGKEGFSFFLSIFT